MNGAGDHKYPYGETPEEVIRERAAEYFVTLDLVGSDDSGELLGRLRDSDPDDLLTVLDALYQGWIKYARESEDSSEYDERCIRLKALRISVLAALGIEES